MPYSRSLLLLAMLAGPPAVAAPTHWCGMPQPHPLDAAFAEAIAHSGGVTVDMREAQSRAYDGWDAELNRLYRNVMRQFDGDLRADALRQAQRAWLGWDQAEAASDLAMQQDTGTSGPLVVADQAIARRRDRACTLSMLLD